MGRASLVERGHRGSNINSRAPRRTVSASKAWMWSRGGWVQLVEDFDIDDDRCLPAVKLHHSVLHASWTADALDHGATAFSDGEYEAMRDDQLRTSLFAEAIRRRLDGHTGEYTVLDIGTGPFALLALFAARAGAQRVFAVEANPLVAERARKAIAAATDVAPGVVEVRRITRLPFCHGLCVDNRTTLTACCAPPCVHCAQVIDGLSTDVELPCKVALSARPAVASRRLPQSRVRLRSRACPRGLARHASCRSCHIALLCKARTLRVRVRVRPHAAPTRVHTARMRLPHRSTSSSRRSLVRSPARRRSMSAYWTRRCNHACAHRLRSHAHITSCACTCTWYMHMHMHMHMHMYDDRSAPYPLLGALSRARRHRQPDNERLSPREYTFLCAGAARQAPDGPRVVHPHTLPDAVRAGGVLRSRRWGRCRVGRLPYGRERSLRRLGRRRSRLSCASHPRHRCSRATLGRPPGEAAARARALT